jgi:hypothetical protein
VHRSYNGRTGEHFYTVSLSEAACCGFALEFASFYHLYASAQAGTAPTSQSPADAGIVDEDTDTPYVPTPADVVERMLHLAGVGPSDYLIDIGSGDGRIVLTAVAKFGARGHGIEIDPRLIERSRQSATKMGIADRAQFLAQDLFESDFSKATVISVYLLPKVMQLLTPKLAALRPGKVEVRHLALPVGAGGRNAVGIQADAPHAETGARAEAARADLQVLRVVVAQVDDQPGHAAHRLREVDHRAGGTQRGGVDHRKTIHRMAAQHLAPSPGMRGLGVPQGQVLSIVFQQQLVGAGEGVGQGMAHGQLAGALSLRGKGGSTWSFGTGSTGVSGLSASFCRPCICS